MSWSGPLCTEGSGGGVVDELGGLGLGWSRGGRGLAQGALAGSHRGSAGGICWEVGGSSDAARAQLAGSRVLPAQVGGMNNLERSLRFEIYITW